MFPRMSWLLVFALVLSLAPFDTARADSSEDWPQDWQGTITSSYHLTERWDYNFLSWPDKYPATSHNSETVRVRVFVQGDGTALQTVSYKKSVNYQNWFAGCGYGTYTGYVHGTSMVPVPAPVVNGEYIATMYDDSVTTITERVDEAQGCWPLGITQLPPVGTPVHIYIQWWYHNGAFTSDDTQIAGRDTWPTSADGPGGNFVDKVRDCSSSTAECTWTGTSARFTSFVLARGEHAQQDTPYLSQEWKDALTSSAYWLDKCGVTGSWLQFGLQKKEFKKQLAKRAMTALGVVSTACDLAARYDGWLAKDPPDPNFKQIATPVTPTTSAQPIEAGDGLTQAQADAIGALATNLQEGIGLARAMLTAFDRASGAQVAGDTHWVHRQLHAASHYAGQYAILLEQRPQLLVEYTQAISSLLEGSVSMSAESLRRYQNNLLFVGLSPDEKLLFEELGANEQALEEILSSKLESDLGDDAPTPGTLAVVPDDLADPLALQSISDLALAMHAFSESSTMQIVFLPTISH